MKGLLIKDLKLMKNMIRFIAMIIVFSVVFSTMAENLFFSMGYICTFIAILAISSVSYDEYDNGLAYLFTLPFERKQYVQEKYLFSAILILAGVLVSAVISLVVSIATGMVISFEELIAVIIASVCVATLMIAVILPAQIKYGSEKGRIAMVVGILGACIVAYGVVTVIEMTGVDVESAVDKLFVSPVKMFLTAGVGAGVVLAVSYFMSVKIIEKKEF